MYHRIFLIYIHYKIIFRVNACPPQSTFRSCVKTISGIRVFWDKTVVLLRDLFLLFLWHNIWYIYYLMSCSHSPDFLGFDIIYTCLCACVCLYNCLAWVSIKPAWGRKILSCLAWVPIKPAWGRKIHWIFCYHLYFTGYFFFFMSSALFSFEDFPPQFVWLYSFCVFSSY